MKLSNNVCITAVD